MRILLIEDEKLTAEAIASKLRFSHAVDIAWTGEKGKELAEMNEYDLFIIDYNLPDTDGVTVCQHLREFESRVPILMLTGRSEVTDKITALDAGADDYLTKPFHFDELLARIRALLRRNRPERDSHTTLKIADLTFDTKLQVVTRGGKLLHLRRKERQLLEHLLRHRGRTITRDMMMQHVWEGTSDPIGNTIDVHISRLRESVDKGFSLKLIKTVYGYGYQLNDLPDIL